MYGTCQQEDEEIKYVYDGFFIFLFRKKYTSVENSQSKCATRNNTSLYPST